MQKLLADNDDWPAELENRKSAWRAVLDSHKTSGKVTDKVQQTIEQQYAADMKSLLDKIEAGRA